MWANGATGLLNANSLNSLKTAISGLSKEQALLVLSTKNLSKAQTEQVLSVAGLLNGEKQLTTAQISERLAKELNSKADAEALLINSGLITQKELEENATIKVTAAKINDAIANGTLSASDAGVIAGALGITGVNTGAIISFDLLTASIWTNIKALGVWLVTNPIGWAILGGTAIFGLVKAYDALTDSVEEVKERTGALLEAYNSAISEANSNAQTIESLAARYEQLSKGINRLGENVSLTTDEYSEYNDIVNQIADMFPTLIAGYTDEGNAILSLKGNVEELRDVYKEAQQDAYNMLITSGEDSDGNDIIKQWKNTQDPGFWAGILDLGSDDVDGGISVTDALEQLNAIQQMSAKEYNEIKRITGAGSHEEIEGLTDIEKKIGYGSYLYKALGLDSNTTDKEFQAAQRQAKALAQTYNAEIESALSDVETLANAYLMTNEDYAKLDEESKNAASVIVNNLNADIASGFHSKEDVGAYVDDIVQMISTNTEAKDALIGLLTMDTTDMPVDRIQSAVDSYINTIAEFLKEDPLELKIRLGFEDVDTTSQNYNHVMQQAATKFSGESYKSYSDNPLYNAELEALNKFAEENSINTQDEIALWNKCIEESDTREEAMKKYLESSDTNNPISSFQDTWDSLDTTEDNDLKGMKENLLSLAESGLLTRDTFNETEGSNSFLSMLGIESNDIDKIDALISKINQLKSSSEQLSSMKNGISGLSENLSYREQNPGVAIDADVLAGMDDGLKEQTEEWERYEKVLGDASSSMDEVKAATNDLATAYVNSHNFLAKLTEENKKNYISQLDAMGVENAEAVVTETLAAKEEVLKYKADALAAAKKDMADGTRNATQEFLQEAQISNLAKNELIDLIAYQSIFASQDLSISQKITELNNLAYAYLGVSDAISISSAMGAHPNYYTEDYIQNKYNEIKENQRKNSISINLNPPGNNKNPKNTKDETKETEKEFEETFNWIERCIKKLQSAFDKWINRAETALTSGFINNYYKKAASSAKSQLSTYDKSYNKYMEKANALDLDETYAKKVRNGTIDIEEIRAKGTEKEIEKYKELAEKIKKYQDYYDKAQDSMDSFMETVEKFYNLPLDKAARKADIFSDRITLLDKKLENATKSKDKTTIIKQQITEKNYTLKAYKTAKTESKTNLKSAKKQLKKNENLNADDGITKKEKKKVKAAVKAGNEVNLAFFTEDSAGYKAAVKYNEALKANKQAVYDAESALQDYNSWLAEAYEKIYNLPLEKAAAKIEKFNGSIDLLNKKLGNAIGSTDKNKLIDQQTNKEKNILNAYKKAEEDSETNLKKAKKQLKKNKNLNADDGINAKEKKKIQNAMKNNKEVDLSFFKKGTAGYKAAEKYNQALKANKKAADDAASAQEDYNRWLVESAKLKFDNIADDYNKKIQMIGYNMSALDNKISEIEASGRKVDKSFYEDQKKVNAQMLAQYQAEKVALENNIKNIKYGTDEWYDAYDQIQQVESAISDCTKKTYELNNAINQIHFDLLDDISKSIGRIITEQEFLQGLFAHEKNTDKKTGTLTDAGLANLGALSVNYYASEDLAEKYRAEIKELKRMLDSGSLSSDLLGLNFNSKNDAMAYLEDVYDKLQDVTNNIYSFSTKIHDIMEEMYRTELDYLKDLIDAKKNALNAEKDLHDYNRTINEKTSDINTIRKQIAAYSGDTSEEGMAKLQKLQKELSDKEDDLKETEYNRYISDQQDMLDKLYEEYSDKLEEKIENFMVLVQEGLETANTNMSAIKDYLDKTANDNNYTPETNGLYDGSSGDIKTNVGNTTKNIIDAETKRSQETAPATVTPSAQVTTPPAPITTPPAQATTPPAPITTPPRALPTTTLFEERNRSDYIGLVKDYINTHAKKATKAKKDYADVNKKIYENKSKSYNGTGKVLNTTALKELAKKLGIKYDNPSKTGTLYKALKKMKFPGFKKGGIVSVDDIKKQVKDNGDDGIVSVRNGESILTGLQTEEFRQLAEETPEMLKDAANLANMGWMLPISRPMPEISNAENMNNIVNIDNITLPNVTNYDEFKNRMFNDMQNDRKYLQFAKDSSVNLLDGAGRLARNRTRF